MKLIAKFAFVYIAMMINVGCATMSPQQRDMFRRGMASWSETRQNQGGYSNSQLRSIQAQRPTQTNCQSQMGYNGQVQTNCTSQASGVDTSMYQ